MVETLSQVAYGWHIAWMLVFNVLTTGYLILTVVNRMRVPGVRLVWHKPWGRASWPFAFMLLVSVGLLYAVYASRLLAANLLLGYLAGAISWCIAKRLSSVVLVTPTMLVTGLGNPESRLYWSQVADYFSLQSGRYDHMVFLYHDVAGDRCRLELKVPVEHAGHFNQLVHRFVDKRFLPTREEAYG